MEKVEECGDGGEGRRRKAGRKLKGELKETGREAGKGSGITSRIYINRGPPHTKGEKGEEGVEGERMWRARGCGESGGREGGRSIKKKKKNQKKCT